MLVILKIKLCTVIVQPPQLEVIVIVAHINIFWFSFVLKCHAKLSSESYKSAAFNS